MAARNMLVLAFTAGGAAVGFRVVDGYRGDARREQMAFVQKIIDEERAAMNMGGGGERAAKNSF